MKIESLQDLKATIELCRKLGVERIKVGEIEFHLGSLPPKQRRYRKEQPKKILDTNTTYIPGAVNENTKILPDEVDAPDAWENLTEDQKLLWSTNSTQATGDLA